MDEFQKAFQELKRKQSVKTIEMEHIEEMDTSTLDQQIFDKDGNLKRTLVLKLR